MPAQSAAQQRFFGIVRGIQKGDVPKSYSPEAAKVAKEMTPKSVKKLAQTKHKELPEKVREMIRNEVRAMMAEMRGELDEVDTIAAKKKADKEELDALKAKGAYIKARIAKLNKTRM